MKKLVTIFLSSIIGINLFSQSIPMSVFGDVYVDKAGSMISLGPVHLKVDAESNKVAKVANFGKLNMVDSVIFYSTDSSDGLLMNKADPSDATVGVTASRVIVRKTFDNTGWYQVSFPFDVNIQDSVRNAFTGTKLTFGGTGDGDFYVQWYDAQKRATNGKADDRKGSGSYTNWTTYSAPTTLQKGRAYRIAVDPGAGTKVVDFAAQNTDITDLFAMKTKGVSLTFAQCPPSDTNPSGTIYLDPENSQGWNAIGGLNTTNYIVKTSTIGTGYQDPVYYYNDKAQMWTPIYPAVPDSVSVGTLRPYAVIFVQKHNSSNLNFDGSTGSGFTYLGDPSLSGLALDTLVSSPVFRSSASGGDDFLRLDLTSATDTEISSNIYFRFNDSYSQSFISSDGDCVLMDSQSPTYPTVWSIVPNLYGANDKTFVNCVPYNNNEIPLGVNIPVAGEYNFSLKDVVVTNGIKSAVLLDKSTGTQTDMLNSDYPFQVSAAATDAARFVLFINKSVTAIDQVTTAEIYAYAENNILTVKNLNSGDKVQVFDLSGRIIVSGIASSNTYSTTLSQKGVYVVNVRGVKTLKVLNK